MCRNCHLEIHADVERFNGLKSLIDYKVEHYIERPPKIDKKTIYEMADSQMSRGAIARQIGCSKSTISLVLKKRTVEWQSGLSHLP